MHSAYQRALEAADHKSNFKSLIRRSMCANAHIYFFVSAMTSFLASKDQSIPIIALCQRISCFYWYNWNIYIKSDNWCKTFFFFFTRHYGYITINQTHSFVQIFVARRITCSFFRLSIISARDARAFSLRIRACNHSLTLDPSAKKSDMKMKWCNTMDVSK